MDLTILTPLAVVAVTEFVKRLKANDLNGALTIIVAVVAGLLAGVFHLDGLSILNGVQAGLAAVGIHAVAQQIG